MKRVALITLVVTLLFLGSANATPPPYDVIPPGGLWGPVRGASPAPAASTPTLPLAPAPRSTADMATVNPTATLIIDDHDTPTAIAVAEATKSTTTPAEHHHHPTTSQPANPTTTDHHHPATQQPSNQTTTIYTCPMHPEVTSDKPGNCPKCGMSLVKGAPKK